MRVYSDAWNRDDLPAGAVATVGNFDGIHRGQQAILERVVAEARSSALIPVVVTFEPHPLEILRPDQAPPRLTTVEQKAALLEHCGIEAMIVVAFNKAFSQMSARRFAEDLLFGRLDVRALYIGSRFVFGRDREGNLELLEEMAAASGRQVTGVGEVVDGNEPVSSTRIRTAVMRGDVDEAARLLGREYAIEGRVVHGEALGRSLGWPTINVEPENALLPAFGVYRSRVVVDGERRAAVTNVGVRPTMHDDKGATLESHILDFAGDLYDQEVVVGFIDRLRGERRFSSADELSGQITRDVLEAKRRFAAEIPSS